MHWGTVEIHGEDGALLEAHVLPFGPNATSEDSLLWWHTTSALCGCNPRQEINQRGVKLYVHHEEPDGHDS